MKSMQIIISITHLSKAKILKMIFAERKETMKIKQTI